MDQAASTTPFTGSVVRMRLLLLVLLLLLLPPLCR